MRTEKQLKALAEARKHIIRKPLSEETKRKIGDANRKQVLVNCAYCNKEFTVKPSKLKKNIRVFCCRKCYFSYVSEILPKEEHNAFGSGLPIEEREKRKNARSKLNHYLRDNHIKRPSCEKCGNNKAEAHHFNYNKPLDVIWLCFKCHREIHRLYDNPELIEKVVEK